jgi:hypothetical protein
MNRARGCQYFLYCACNFTLPSFLTDGCACHKLVYFVQAFDIGREGEIIRALLSRRKHYALSDVSMYLTQVTEVCRATNELDHIPTLMSYSWIGFSSMRHQLSWLNVCLQLLNTTLCAQYMEIPKSKFVCVAYWFAFHPRPVHLGFSRQRKAATDFLPATSVFHSPYHFTNAPYLYIIHLPLMVHNLSNWQYISTKHLSFPYPSLP